MDDNDSGAIEMSATKKGYFASSTLDQEDNFENEDVVLQTKEPLDWARSRVVQQNRCFFLVLVSLFLVAAVIVVGGVYMGEDTALEGDKYNAESGILSDNFDGAKAQDIYEKEHSSTSAHDWWQTHGKDNPFGNENAVEHGNSDAISRMRWNASHPGQPYPKGPGLNNKQYPGKPGTKFGGNNNGGLRPGGKPGSGNRPMNTPNRPVENTQAGRCDHSGYTDWLGAKVTLSDGIKYEILEKLNHDKGAFVQGLTYARNTLWESTGLYGKSTVRILDPDTADVIKSVDMAATLFGEGMAYWQGRLYQITWKARKGFIYNATTLDTIKEFEFRTTNGEGWGITWDPCQREFVVTDGSHYLHFWDKETLSETRKVPVARMDGTEARNLNEIEWFRGKILANVWYQDVLLVIDPVTGIVEKEYDFSMIFPSAERRQIGADVFNGISVSKDPDILYVTGKKWDRMFKIRLLV